MNTIRISNFAELASYNNKLPNDIDWFKNNNFIIDENIPGIMLHLTGEQFHSSISTTVMKSILKLQESIYRQYSLFVYGDIRRLSTEEKGMLELYVKVENGSSIFEIIPKEIIKAISKKVETMTSREMIASIAAVAIAATFYVSTQKIIDGKQKIKELEIQSQTFTDIQKNTAEAQIEMIKAQTEFYREVSKQENVSKIEINGEEITTSEIKEITKSPRTKYEIISEQITDRFKVTDIHIEDNFVFIDIISNTGFIIKKVQLVEGLVDKDDYQMLKDSTERKFMDMNILVQKKNDTIISAILNGINKD